MTMRVRGPLDGSLLPYGPGFEAALVGQGYSADSIGRHLRLMVHVSRWLAGQHLAAGDLTVGYARQFLRFRQAQGYAHPASMSGMAPLLDYLGVREYLVPERRHLPVPEQGRWLGSRARGHCGGTGVHNAGRVQAFPSSVSNEAGVKRPRPSHG